MRNEPPRGVEPKPLRTMPLFAPDALQRLTRMVGVREDDLFRSAQDLQADAYRRQAERIAYELKREPTLEAPAIGSAAG